MDSEAGESFDIRQWIRRVQEDSENDAERLYVDTKNTSLLKKVERERLSQDITFLKQKYFPSNDELNNINPNTSFSSPKNADKASHPPSSSRPSSIQSPSTHSPKIHSPSSQPPKLHSDEKPTDEYKNSYTKFGAKPPNLEELVQYRTGHHDLAAHARAARNARDLELLDFDHPTSESEWKRKFGTKEARGPPADDVEFSQQSNGAKKKPDAYPTKEASPNRNPTNNSRLRTGSPRKDIHRSETLPKERPRKDIRSKSPRKESPRAENPKMESRSSPRKEITSENAASGLSLVANFDPLAIEAHSLLHNWVAGNSLDKKEGEPASNASPSRWQQLRAGIQDLGKPSMLLPSPPAPHSLSHHTASSKAKIMSDSPKDEIKSVKAAPSPPHDPRPQMEMRHEQVHRIEKRRAELRAENASKMKAEEEKRAEEKHQEEAKRKEEKRKKDMHAKQMETEVSQIKARREEEAALIKEEELKILEAHKIEVQKKLRIEREQLELEQARRIGEIKKDEGRKRDEMREAKYFELAKTHADRKVLQKCLSTWFFHVRELKLKLEKFKVVCDWKKVNSVFKTWRRFSHNSRAEREANQFASRAKEDQRSLDRAIKFRDYRVTLRCFLIWLARAKLKGEERQTQQQHELRKQQMAQFLLKAKQLPNMEAPPAPVSPTAKIAKPVAKKPVPQRGIPVPPQEGSSSPNSASPNPSSASPRRRPSPMSRPSPNSVSDKPADVASPVLTEKSKVSKSGDSDPAHDGQSTETDAASKKTYTSPGASRAYLEMESRAEQRKNRRKELELKYQEAQKQKELKMREEEEKEKERLEAEKHARMEQKRLAKQKEAAEKRRKEIDERSEKLAIAHDGKRLLKFYCWLPWRKYMTMQLAKSEAANLHFERKLISKIAKLWREITQRLIEEKLTFADEFYADSLQQRFLRNWNEALRVSRMRMDQAQAFHGAQVQKRHFLMWFGVARLALDKRAAEELRKELEMETYCHSAILKKTWRAWRRYVILEKEERKSEKRKDDLRQKAHVWLQQYRQV